MKIFLSLILSISFCLLTAQSSIEKCGTSDRILKKLEKDPNMKDRLDKIESRLQQWISSNNSKRKSQTIITIPVVVHVLYENVVQNITEAQIRSQITVLNEDFRKLNSDFSNTPAPFQAAAADCELQFCLAQIDPDGDSTNGITRTLISSSFNMETDYFDTTAGGAAPWDNTKYLNIWVGDLGPSLLGFATPPGVASGDDDGVVVDDNSFGTVGTAANNQPNHLGRTTTHEVGHYFNLFHLWGRFGGCNDDDQVSDTPEQMLSTFGCPSFPLVDQCTYSGDGIMFMNFMDYVDDPCMTMFTDGQKQRMLAAINTSRSGLLSTNICTASGIGIDEKLNVHFEVYPNPANHQLTINIEGPGVSNLQLKIYSLSGQVLLQKALRNTKSTLDISSLPTGVYAVKVDGKSINLNKKFVKL